MKPAQRLALAGCGLVGCVRPRAPVRDMDMHARGVACFFTDGPPGSRCSVRGAYGGEGARVVYLNALTEICGGLSGVFHWDSARPPSVPLGIQFGTGEGVPLGQPG